MSSAGLHAIRSLIRAVHAFVRDMGTTPLSIKIWASLFPFPQILVGGYLSWTRSGGPAAWYFIARVLSFLIAGQVFQQAPFTKMVGPIMHIPFLLVVPISIEWLLYGNQNNNEDVNMTRFVTYTTIVSSISLLIDIKTAYAWCSGENPGYLKSLPPDKQISSAILVIPSVMMGIIGWSWY